MQVIASMGLHNPAELKPHMLRRRISELDVMSYADLVHALHPGELLAQPPAGWATDWSLADPDRFIA